MQLKELQAFLDDSRNARGEALSGPHLITNENGRIEKHPGYYASVCSGCGGVFIQAAPESSAATCGDYHCYRR